jgi:hypothetical protein
MLIIGCDWHPRYEEIAMLDTTTGEIVRRRLEHENGKRLAWAVWMGLGWMGILPRGHFDGVHLEK